MAAEASEGCPQGAATGRQRRVTAGAAVPQVGGLPLHGLSGGACRPRLREVCAVCGVHLPLVARLRCTAGHSSFQKKRRFRGRRLNE